ncbi:unnamed protein product, partial [Iphiclides podalirius]
MRLKCLFIVATALSTVQSLNLRSNQVSDAKNVRTGVSIDQVTGKIPEIETGGHGRNEDVGQLPNGHIFSDVRITKREVIMPTVQRYRDNTIRQRDKPSDHRRSRHYNPPQQYPSNPYYPNNPHTLNPVLSGQGVFQKNQHPQSYQGRTTTTTGNTKETEAQPLTVDDNVIFGGDSCPTGYVKVAKINKCVASL